MKKRLYTILTLISLTALTFTSCCPIGEKGDKGEQGEQGIQGKPGEAGSMWYTGEGIPDENLGKIGDLYLNNLNGDVYQKEESGWVKKTNLQGEPGEDGEDGEDGSDGRPGSDGKPGENGETAWSSTILPSEHGYITASRGSQIVGEEITFTFVPDIEGVPLDEIKVIWTINGETFEGGLSVTKTMVEGGFVVKAEIEDFDVILSLGDVYFGTAQISDHFYKFGEEIPQITFTPEEGISLDDVYAYVDIYSGNNVFNGEYQYHQFIDIMNEILSNEEEVNAYNRFHISFDIKMTDEMRNEYIDKYVNWLKESSIGDPSYVSFINDSLGVDNYGARYLKELHKSNLGVGKFNENYGEEYFLNLKNNDVIYSYNLITEMGREFAESYIEGYLEKIENGELLPGDPLYEATMEAILNLDRNEYFNEHYKEVDLIKKLEKLDNFSLSLNFLSSALGIDSFESEESLVSNVFSDDPIKYYDFIDKVIKKHLCSNPQKPSYVNDNFFTAIDDSVYGDIYFDSSNNDEAKYPVSLIVNDYYFEEEGSEENTSDINTNVIDIIEDSIKDENNIITLDFSKMDETSLNEFKKIAEQITLSSNQKLSNENLILNYDLSTKEGIDTYFIDLLNIFIDIIKIHTNDYLDELDVIVKNEVEEFIEDID